MKTRLFDPNKRPVIPRNIVPVQDQIRIERELTRALRLNLSKPRLQVPDEELRNLVYSAIPKFLVNQDMIFESFHFGGGPGKDSFDLINSFWIEHPRFKQRLLLNVYQTKPWQRNPTVIIRLCAPHYKMASYLDPEHFPGSGLSEKEADSIGKELLLGELASFPIVNRGKVDSRGLRYALQQIGAW